MTKKEMIIMTVFMVLIATALGSAMAYAAGTAFAIGQATLGCICTVAAFMEVVFMICVAANKWYEWIKNHKDEG